MGEATTVYKDNWHIREICTHLEAVTHGRIRRLIINIPPRHMKPLRATTPVWTLNGWKHHGDLCVGDYVFGIDGLPKRVQAVTPVFIEPSYCVRFDTGEELIAGIAHEWLVEREEGWPRNRKELIVETKDLRIGTNNRRPDRIRYHQSLWGFDADLPIDPYTYGAWLGDGEKNASSIGACAQDAAHFRKQFGDPPESVYHDRRKNPYHRFRIPNMSTILRANNIGDKDNIPIDYLRGSQSQRLAFLQGLMDTDGHCFKDGTACFSNTNRLLIDTVLHLVASLGIKASCREKRSVLNGHDYGPYWQVSFRGKDGINPFRLPRKAERLRMVENERYKCRYIQSVEDVGQKAVNCITVEDGMYLAGKGMIPTHNSLSVSVAWPAWSWIHRPSIRFLFASYAQRLSDRDSRKCRNLIKSRRFASRWARDFTIRGDADTISKFENNRGGYRMATSVGGVLTGEGGDIIVIDDAHKVDEAESDLLRESVINWWDEAMSTRLNNPQEGAFVIIMQRIHHNDLVGHLLKQGDWVHLCLPARYEHDHPHLSELDPRETDGDLLWPDHFDNRSIDDLENSLGSYGAAGQLQQRPAPRSGGMFDRGWWEIVPAAPAGGVEVRGWDLAGSEISSAAWTAGVKMKRVNGIFYILDVDRFRGTPGKVEFRLSRVASQDGRDTVIDIPQDPGQAGKGQVRYLIKQLAGYVVRFSRESGAKEQRAEPLSSQVEAGNVKLVRGNWNEKFISEAALFPNSDYTDQIDAASRAFHRIIASDSRGVAMTSPRVYNLSEYHAVR